MLRRLFDSSLSSGGVDPGTRERAMLRKLRINCV